MLFYSMSPVYRALYSRATAGRWFLRKHQLDVSHGGHAKKAYQSCFADTSILVLFQRSRALQVPDPKAEVFFGQCPTATRLHPGGTGTGNSTLQRGGLLLGRLQGRAGDRSVRHYTYNPPLTFTDNGGLDQCQQVSGGDGMMT